MKRRNSVLVTGIAGFAGSFLAEKLIERGFAVHGILAPGEPTDNIAHIISRTKLDKLDILRHEKVVHLIRKIGPRYIFHLAAMASVGRSLKLERATLETNILGSLNIFEGALAVTNLEKLVVVGSADSYGKISLSGMLLGEKAPFHPISPYGISKAAAEYLAGYYGHQYHLPAVVARSFTHAGPRQSDHFVISSFCRQIAEIEKGITAPEMRVGDLSARRDFSDVRDIVEGYYLLARKGMPGEAYNLSSGKAVAIATILRKLLRLTKVKITVTIDKNRLRKSDIPVLRGNNRKAIRELGWKRKYNLDRTLKDTLEYWREKTAGRKF